MCAVLFCWAGVFSITPFEGRGLKPITHSQGLSDLLVNAIYNDSSGFIWFGTESSLDRFDGNHIVRYPIEGDARKSRRVLAITEGDDGLIYVGSNQGLFVLKRNAGTLTRLFADKIDFSVSSFARGKDGILYIGTRHGIFIYNTRDGKLKQKLLVEDNLSEENDVIGVVFTLPDYLYILTPKKLWRMGVNTGNLQAYTLPVAYRATCMGEIGKIIYIGTEGDGVVPFSEADKTFGKRIMPGNGVVTSVSATNNGNLMVSTDGEGIYFYSTADGALLHNLTTASGSRRQLRSNSVYTALSDNRGLLWIGYYQSGVDYTPYDEGVIKVYNNREMESGSDMSVRAFAVNTNGSLGLVGTPDGAVLINKETGTMRKFEKPVMDSNLVFTAVFLNGAFYVGTYHGGIYRIDPAGGISRFGPPELSKSTIFKLEIDPKGNLWAGTSEGLYRFEGSNPAKFQKFTSVNSQLPQGNVYEIFFDSTGRGWVCTENGMAVWNGSHLQTTGFPSGFINGMKIRTVYEDSRHNLYFAPDRGEIWKADLSLKHFAPLKIGVGGRFAQFTSIIEDNKGHLWFGTDKGMVRYEGDGKYEIFNSAENVVNPVYTLATPYKDQNGDLWFGSTSGLHYVNPKQAEAYINTLHDFKLDFTSIYSNGEAVDSRIERDGDAISVTLGRDEADLTVYVSDFSYRYLDNLEIEYMLEGYDEEWHHSTGNHAIEYRDLPAGKYTLKVREAGNPDSEIQLGVNKKGDTLWGWIIAIIVVLAGATAVMAVMMARRRSGRSGREAEPEEATQGEESARQPEGKKQAEYRTTRLSEEECKRLYRKLEGVMKNDRPYINPDLKSKELAAMIDTSAHALSFLFNQYLHKSYYDYVNEYRVEEFKRMVKDADLSKYTLSTLAERCGFSSRASFFRHFKAVTGMTPSEYLKGFGA